jgi:hypothetical protein
MSKPIATITVEVGGDTHVLEVRKIDLVRAERALNKSVTRMDTLADIYELAWVKLRAMDVAGTPVSFDEWLDLEPDVDAVFDDGEDAGGKGSGPDQPTG